MLGCHNQCFGPCLRLKRDYCIDMEWIEIAEREIARPIACEILSTCASTQQEGLLGVADLLGHETEGVAAELAVAAWDACAPSCGWVPGSIDANLYYIICAEAESLLRSGWFPGEPAEWY